MPRVDPGCRSSSIERVEQAARRDARARARGRAAGSPGRRRDPAARPRSRTTASRAAPIWAVTVDGGVRGRGEQRGRWPRRWSRRPPCPPSTWMRRGRRPMAASRASSRSVASLAAGWRSIRAPAAVGRGQRRRRHGVEVADGEVDRAGRGPARGRCRSRPRSRRRPSATAARCAGSTASPPVITTTISLALGAAMCRFPPPALPGSGSSGRWRAVAGGPPSQPGYPELPFVRPPG